MIRLNSEYKNITAGKRPLKPGQKVVGNPSLKPGQKVVGNPSLKPGQKVVGNPSLKPGQKVVRKILTLTTPKKVVGNPSLKPRQKVIAKELPSPQFLNPTYSIIPLNLFLTWNTLDLPEKMKKNVELLKNQNPEFTCYLYDDKMCREFIKTNFDEDVLYTYDKLIPGAYKSDLWRYCVLYKYGGIYLDIKYACLNNFKLKYLTDKEYYVRDRTYNDITGIYNAMLICLPNNNILYKCIETIIENVKNNIYDTSELLITGPHMIAQFFNEIQIKKLSLSFSTDGKFILYNDTQILKTYDEYRNEQQLNFKKNSTKYYKDEWNNKNIYNYKSLEPKKSYNYTKQITKNILGKQVELFSGTPNIIEVSDNSYLINIRWINYSFNDDGTKVKVPAQWVSLNSRFKVDSSFNKISEEVFLEENFEIEKNYNGMGLEDMRIINYNGIYYYAATHFDSTRKITSISSDVYDISDKTYKLNRNIILPTMYNLKHIIIFEKNWSFVLYKNELCVIYNWFPLQIGQINYMTKKLDIVEIKYNIPDFFKDVRGTSCGYIKNNEIWFVIHKSQGKVMRNYQHSFAVFDLDLNLIRYSELFKLGNSKVEFCTGLILKDDSIILSYSLMDTISLVSEYDIDYINNKIKWYNTKKY
jgi:mannosyltransferase OCH1-like enzyme/predicted GH43/DUF377 family glycosyl hydrolase